MNIENGEAKRDLYQQRTMSASQTQATNSRFVSIASSQLESILTLTVARRELDDLGVLSFENSTDRNEKLHVRLCGLLGERSDESLSSVTLSRVRFCTHVRHRSDGLSVFKRVCTLLISVIHLTSIEQLTVWISIHPDQQTTSAGEAPASFMICIDLTVSVFLWPLLSW